jgi:hypothetical protein
MLSHAAAFGVGVVLGVVFMVVAGLWADNRTQEFMRSTHEGARPDWAGG